MAQNSFTFAYFPYWDRFGKGYKQLQSTPDKCQSQQCKGLSLHRHFATFSSVRKWQGEDDFGARAKLACYWMPGARKGFRSSCWCLSNEKLNSDTSSLIHSFLSYSSNSCNTDVHCLPQKTRYHPMHGIMVLLVHGHTQPTPRSDADVGHLMFQRAYTATT